MSNRDAIIRPTMHDGLTPLFGYPGGKTQHLDKIIPGLTRHLRPGVQFREPFVGLGSVSTYFSERELITDLWINDKDPGIAALWTAILRHPRLLQKRLCVQPSVELFRQFRHKLLEVKDLPDNSEELVDLGFIKMAEHLMSYSNLGERSGGPRTEISSRYNSRELGQKIGWRSDILSRIAVRCTCLDFADVLADDSTECVYYLDPPYWSAGKDLYRYFFHEADHVRLATLLRKLKAQWLLSYDDSPEIRQLYSWAVIDTIQTRCSISPIERNGVKEQQYKTELLIRPRSMSALGFCDTPPESIRWSREIHAGAILCPQSTSVEFYNRQIARRTRNSFKSTIEVGELLREAKASLAHIAYLKVLHDSRIDKKLANKLIKLTYDRRLYDERLGDLEISQYSLIVLNGLSHEQFEMAVAEGDFRYRTLRLYKQSTSAGVKEKSMSSSDILTEVAEMLHIVHDPVGRCGGMIRVQQDGTFNCDKCGKDVGRLDHEIFSAFIDRILAITKFYKEVNS